jgi:transposase
LDPRLLVFVDECGTHTSMTRLRARAPKGERVYGRVPRNRGKNTTLIASMNARGIGPCLTVVGATTKLAFESYMEQFLAPTLRSGQVVVMDNLNAHKGERVRELVEGSGGKLLYLPTYSPDLNPIEEAFSKIKGSLRKATVRTREALIEELGSAISAITADDALGFFTHVRAIALSHTDPDLIVAGIELGGIVRSTDGGESWQDQRPGAYADCHSLAAHSRAPNLLYEAAGGGFAESKNFGESWSTSDEGLGHRYVWGLAIDRDNPELVYVSAAQGPSRAHGSGFSDAVIYRRSGEDQWKAVLESLAEFPYALASDPATPGALYAGLGDGTILRSPDKGENWEEVVQVPELEALAAVAT